MKNFLLITVLLFLTSCSSKHYTLFKSDSTYQQNNQYSESEINFENKIAPKDRVSIEIVNVYNQANLGLSQNQNVQSGVTSASLINSKSGFLVGSDGQIFLPLIGYMKISGLTVAEASELLTQKYKKYLKRPYVKVNILNQRVYVLGEVKKPGVVPVLNSTMTVFEAIARSGGLTDYSKRDMIAILDTSSQKPKIRTVDLTHISSLTNTNILLKPKDIVYIPPRDMKGFNVGVKEALPILQAISSALAPFATIKYLEKN